MSTYGATYNTQIVHREVLKSFQKLSQSMDLLTEPDLLDHCRIWKHQKGAKKLIELAIESDRFINKEAKSMKSFHDKAERDGAISSHQGQDLTTKIKVMKLEPIEPNEYITPMIEDRKMEEKMSESQQCQESLCDNQEKVNKQEENVKSEESLQENDDSEFAEQVQSKKVERSKKKYLRGPYKNYPRQVKQKMVQLYKSNAMSISKISSQYGVPIKNIKRWAQNGIDRKQGAGRKRLDPNMEYNLLLAIKQKFPLHTQLRINEIRYLALNLSRLEDFKASKGWIISFIERFNLHEIYQIIS